MENEVKRIRIGIDLDDTITDIYEEMHQKAYEFDLSIKGHGVIDNSKYLVGEKYGWDSLQLDYFFKNYRTKIIEHARIRKDAVEVLNELYKFCDIFIITARNPKYYNNLYDDTYVWLQKHNIPFTKLIVNSKDKVLICKSEKIDVFVDDMPQNCEKVYNNLKIKVCIMDNHDNYCENKHIERIYDFNDLRKLIKRMD